MCAWRWGHVVPPSTGADAMHTPHATPRYLALRCSLGRLPSDATAAGTAPAGTAPAGTAPAVKGSGFKGSLSAVGLFTEADEGNSGLQKGAVEAHTDELVDEDNEEAALGDEEPLSRSHHRGRQDLVR